MDQQLIAALNELSQKAKEQKTYEDRIAKLEKKRSQTTFHAKSVHVEEKPAHQAQDILDRSFKKTESTIKAIKVLVWIVAVAAIILSGIGVVKQLLQGDNQMLFMFIASFVAAGISAFCFRRISNGDGGCLSWIFGINSALLSVGELGYSVVSTGTAGIIFGVCVVVGIGAGILAVKWEGWQNGVRRSDRKRIENSDAYRAAADQDALIKRDNEKRREEEVERQRKRANEAQKALNDELSQLRQKKKQLDEELKANTIFPYHDLHMLDRVIQKLEGMRASSVQEALQACDREDKEEKEKAAAAAAAAAAARAAAAAAAAAAEAERKRNAPGHVVIYATEDGKGKNADVYVDGGYYGAINYVLGWTSLSLNPGAHSVVVVIHSQGYSFRSAPQSFYLEGGSEVNLKFALLGYNNIYCSQW